MQVIFDLIQIAGHVQHGAVPAIPAEAPRGKRSHTVRAHVGDGHSLGGSGSAWAEISKPAGSRLPRRWIPRRRVVTCTLVRKTDNSYGDEHSITNTHLLASCLEEAI